MTVTRQEHLAPTFFVESEHPDVVAFARDATAATTTEREAVAALFAAVRDEIRYDPYAFRLHRDRLRASEVLGRRRDWCTPKATLLAAACRSIGVPARLGFADVRNHLSSEKLSALMGTDVFAWHGYTVIEVDGAWRKASPAFNAELCERFGVAPLEFDGTQDALLHAYDGEGRRHMEYVADHGTFDDLPFGTMIADLLERYPGFQERLEAAERGETPDDEAFRPAG